MPPFPGKYTVLGATKKKPPIYAFGCLDIVRTRILTRAKSLLKAPSQRNLQWYMAFFVAHTAGIKLFRILTGFLSVSCFFHHTADAVFCQIKKPLGRGALKTYYFRSASISTMKPSLSSLNSSMNSSSPVRCRSPSAFASFSHSTNSCRFAT